MTLSPGLPDADLLGPGVLLPEEVPGSERGGVPLLPQLRRLLPAVHQQLQEQGRLLHHVRTPLLLDSNRDRKTVLKRQTDV